MVSCSPGSLIGATGWLPAEPFDYNWDRFGCNRLKCGRCGQWVQSTVLPDGEGRHYACACQEHDAYEYHLLGSDQGQIHEFVTAWDCGGHPELGLPAILDGIAIPADGNFGALVAAALRSPPFVAPGVRSPSFWVQRLYRLMRTDGLGRAVGDAVAAQLSSSDPITLRAALDFFTQIPNAPGAERLAPFVEREQARLSGTPDPFSSSYNLYERALEGIERQLIEPLSAPVRDVARRSLLDGVAGSGMIYRVAEHDRDWFCNRAADIVRAQPSKLGFALQALKAVPAHDRVRALRNLQRIDSDTRDEVHRFVSSLGEPDRTDTLNELTRDPT